MLFYSSGLPTSSKHPTDGSRGISSQLCNKVISRTPCRGAAGSIGSCIGVYRGVAGSIGSPVIAGFDLAVSSSEYFWFSATLLS